MAVEQFTEAIRLDPEYADAYNNRGDAYDKLGEYQLAIEDYDDVIRLDPQYAWASNNRGYAYQRLRMGEEAERDWAKAKELAYPTATPRPRATAVPTATPRPQAYPTATPRPSATDSQVKDAEYAFQLGRTHYDNSFFEVAIEQFTKAISLNPKHAQAYKYRGIVYDELGEHERAIPAYDEAIRLDPEYPWAYYHRGRAYQALGMRDEAARDSAKASELGFP
jgi:tetratricopeptide (TPR) repeat protein